MLYDNDDEHKGSDVDFEENLHCNSLFSSIILSICNVNIIIIDTIKLEE